MITPVRSWRVSSPQPIMSVVNLALATVILIALLFQAYPTFSSYFMADDFTLLEFVYIHESILSIVLSPSPWGFTTPLPNVFIWIVSRLSAANPERYYAFNMLMHVINAVLVFKLIRLVAIHRNDLALSVAAIFLVHFVHFSDWGVAIWISAFNQLIVAFFYLCSYILFLHYIYHRQTLHYAASLICFALALASKETAASLPILLSGWYLIGLRSFQKQGIRGTVMLMPFFFTLGAYLIYELSFQSSGAYFQKGLYGIGPHLISNWKYFSNLVMPNPTSPPVQSYLLRTFPAWVIPLSQCVAWMVRTVLFLTAAALFWKGPSRIRLWVAWAVITYLPFLGFVEGFAGPNRYFYLPAVGFSALLAEGLLWIYGYLRKRFSLRAAGTIFLVVVLVLWGYNLVPIRVWQKQMSVNSAVRRQVLRAIDTQLNSKSVSTVYLQGFPDKFADLRTAIRVFYALDAEWIGATANEGARLSSNALVLQYDAGRISVTDKR